MTDKEFIESIMDMVNYGASESDIYNLLEQYKAPNLNGRQSGKTETQGKIYKDYRELQMRREVEQWADELDLDTKRAYGSYWLEDDNAEYEEEFWNGPFTLPELHAKLLELKGEM